MPEIHTALSDAPLDIGRAISEVRDPDCGGIGVFLGSVRSSSASGSDLDVTALEYEAHPELAPKRLAEIAGEAAQRWDVRRVTAAHRTGHCPLGEATVIVACAAPHRADALEACRWIIDQLKERVPIWKKEIFTNGSSWVGSGS
jgi:molybdopterin synthase catalytic subunit